MIVRISAKNLKRASRRRLRAVGRKRKPNPSREINLLKKDVVKIARRKLYIRGKVYIVNDHLLVKHSKPGRRVVSLNNDKNNMHVRRITSLYDSAGKRKDVIPIEKYPDIPKASGVEKKTFRKTLRGKPIQEKFLKKTKTRLNKWDLRKIIKSSK